MAMMAASKATMVFPDPTSPCSRRRMGEGFLHVGGDFFQHPLLRRRGMERQNLLDGIAHVFVQPESDAGLRFLLAAFQFESQLDEKQFFKDQPDVRGGARRLQVLQALAGIRPVDSPKRLAWRDERKMVAHR